MSCERCGGQKFVERVLGDEVDVACLQCGARSYHAGRITRQAPPICLECLDEVECRPHRWPYAAPDHGLDCPQLRRRR